jgi:MOSC domain-containing protein YiiM
MKLVELRAGLPLPLQHFEDVRAGWPDKVNDSSYEKQHVKSVRCTLEGLEGNAPGYPSHIADSINRAALVYHSDSYEYLKLKFPESAKTLISGGFGENFTVDHADLLPSVVCVGDVYQIGTAQFTVTGPRFPCPKVNAWHYTTGLQKHTLAHGHAGYFVRVTKPGTVSVGDDFTLLTRKNHGYTIKRVSEGLWGPPELLDESIQFYEALAKMDDFIGKGFRDVAISRLQDIQNCKRNKHEPIFCLKNLSFCATRLAVASLFFGAAVAATSLVPSA